MRNFTQHPDQTPTIHGTRFTVGRIGRLDHAAGVRAPLVCSLYSLLDSAQLGFEPRHALLQLFDTPVL
jgi:hypothetical protein